MIFPRFFVRLPRELDQGMSSELVATYSGLGVQDGEEYFKGEECLGKASLNDKNSVLVVVNTLCPWGTWPACVKDLIRALRGDDGSCEIRRQLGKAQVLQKVRE